MSTAYVHGSDTRRTLAALADLASIMDQRSVKVWLPTEKVTLVVDEAHLAMDDPRVHDMVQRIAREGRARGIVLELQDTIELAA